MPADIPEELCHLVDAQHEVGSAHDFGFDPARLGETLVERKSRGQHEVVFAVAARDHPGQGGFPPRAGDDLDVVDRERRHGFRRLEAGQCGVDRGVPLPAVTTCWAQVDHLGVFEGTTQPSQERRFARSTRRHDEHARVMKTAFHAGREKVPPAGLPGWPRPCAMHFRPH